MKPLSPSADMTKRDWIAEAIEARVDWQKAKQENLPAAEVETLRQKVVAAVQELQATK